MPWPAAAEMRSSLLALSAYADQKANSSVPAKPKLSPIAKELLVSTSVICSRIASVVVVWIAPDWRWRSPSQVTAWSSGNSTG
jgi:hypothetical protein